MNSSDKPVQIHLGGLTMNRHNISFALAVLMCLAATVATAPAQITPPAPIQVNSPIITINNSARDQTDPHVDKDFAAYTDSPSNQIRYYQFSTNMDFAIPLGSALFDVLSDVNNGRIAFLRVGLDRNAVFVFDIATSSLTEIDPHAGSDRFNPALGGNTLAFIDRSSGNGDVYAYDLGANPPQPPQPVSLDPNAEQNPNVSPDGNTIVWENCPVSIVNCDVFKGIRHNGVWSVSAVANTPDPEGNPDTDGTWITYDLNSNPFVFGNQHIHYQPAAGGPDTQLVLPGNQQNPSIKNGFIAFESRATVSGPSDLFVYDIANNLLYQVTATPSVDENLNDISVLDNGDIRMVWAANDGISGDENIHATTFTPIHPASYNICPLYDANVAKKSGSAYPIKIQLCDSAGNNLSSPSIVVHAVGVTRTSTNTPAVLDDTGNANPDMDFRYDATLAGYVFNLSTKGYSTGTYTLSFAAGADPSTHSASFAVK